MVYLNLSDDVSQDQVKPTYLATAFSRFFSALLDYFILAPVVSFFIVMFFRESVELVSRSSMAQSNLIILQLAVLAVLLFTGLQTIFIYFQGATPGQTFMKLHLSFEQKTSNLFFQIWFRQIGCVISVLFFGLPFLAILYHDKHRTFYDRLSECDVVSAVPVRPGEVTAFAVYETDKKYLASSVSALMCFAVAILIFSVVQSHDQLLHQVQIASLGSEKIKKCFVMDSQNPEERLKTALALNILNISSDDCTLKEVDDLFTQVKPDAQNVSLAYFIKYYIGQKSVDSGLDQMEYLKYACHHGTKTDLCGVLQNRNVASEKQTPENDLELKNKLLKYIGKLK